MALATSSAADLWDILAREATSESSLWEETLLPAAEQRPAPGTSSLHRSDIGRTSSRRAKKIVGHAPGLQTKPRRPDERSGRRNADVRDDVRLVVADVAGARRFDLDDVGAEERELIGPVRPRQVAGEVEDADARERFRHVASRLALASAMTEMPRAMISAFTRKIFQGTLPTRRRTGPTIG